MSPKYLYTKLFRRSLYPIIRYDGNAGSTCSQGVWYTVFTSGADFEQEYCVPDTLSLLENWSV